MGQVLDEDSNRPIANVAISLRAPARTTLTDRDGRFRFRDLPAGRHELTLRHVGYGERKIEAEVVPGRTTELTIHLPPVAIELEPPGGPRRGAAQAARERPPVGAEIGATEVYRDTHGVPAWALDGEAACGVVAVWLKRWE